MTDFRDDLLDRMIKAKEARVAREADETELLRVLEIISSRFDEIVQKCKTEADNESTCAGIDVHDKNVPLDAVVDKAVKQVFGSEFRGGVCDGTWSSKPHYTIYIYWQ